MIKIPLPPYVGIFVYMVQSLFYEPSIFSPSL